MRAALAALNANLHPQDQISFEAASHSNQHDLSLKLDLAGWQEQLGQATIVGQATLQSEGCLGARAFLAAILCRLAGGAWNLPLLLQNYPLAWAFRMQTRMLGAPRCDGILDVQNYHAGMCAAGGERTQRHHALRDLIFVWAERGGLRPERERPGLLLPQSPHDTSNSGRRPTGICLPALQPGLLLHLTLL